MSAYQRSLFAEDPSPAASGLRGSIRYYQSEAVASVSEEFRKGAASTVLEMATGTGKTRTFSEVARLWPGRVLILAHRDELIQQAKKSLEAYCGEMIGVEQGDFYAGRERIVVGSFDTVRQPRRLERAVAAGYTLIIVDECHHSLAQSYRKTLAALTASGAKLLGVTATPDRGDGRALGAVFESCAYRFSISEGIESGYLVPVHGSRVGVESVDLSNVGSVAGDLNQGELDEVMLGGVEGIVKKTLELWPDRKGIAFFPGIKSAELAAARFNALAPGSAVFVCGKTPEDERRQVMADVRRGKYRYLCNAMIATEGFDWPEASLMICGRPTKSRALFAQMAGRVTRVLPGVVDLIEGRESAGRRREAIAGSAKPHCVIADFVGNSGKHSLAGVEDVLGGSYTEAERKKAKELSKDREVDALKSLDAARAELKRLASSVRSQVRAKVEHFNPLHVFHTKLSASEISGPRATPAQVAGLLKLGVTDKDAALMSKAAASRFFKAAAKRREIGLASYKQLAILRRYGIDAVTISSERASQGIKYISSMGWGTRGEIDGKKLAQLVGVLK